ncbi:hypothetical protein HQN60_15735 (plasmid) [Deefgea piscis]|uniref:Uncharacterized protein n=1 Tax=Deefgea piscis TaxID=2739061 RepID=A0A6M8SSG4_9NEIS|nr:hypothetical protein [Deefgea piscis]QKJ68262.1 hypothetical protein HQN60_15735 [Deefgea piscis]
MNDKNMNQVLNEMEKTAQVIEAFVAAAVPDQLSHDGFLVAQYFPQFIRRHIADIQKLQLTEHCYPALPENTDDPVRADVDRIHLQNQNVSAWLNEQITHTGKR